MAVDAPTAAPDTKSARRPSPSIGEADRLRVRAERLIDEAANTATAAASVEMEAERERAELAADPDDTGIEDRFAAAVQTSEAALAAVLEALGDFVGFISSGPTAPRDDDELGNLLEEKHQREAAASRALRERRRAD